MARVYLDIETASDVQRLAADALAAGVDPASLTDLESYAQLHAGDYALAPEHGRVIAWSVASEDEQHTRVDTGAGERDLLERLHRACSHLRATQYVAHNGLSFDFPFLRWRYLAHGMGDAAKQIWQAKPWGSRLVDTSSPDWVPRPTRSGKGWRYSLDTLCASFGIERDETIPSADVPGAWMAGRYADVEAHVADDIRALRAVYHRLASGRSPIR